MGRARVADDGGEVVRHGPLRRPHRRGEPLGRPGVRPRDDPVVDRGRGDARVLERLGHRGLAERHVGVLAETLLPLVRRGLARDAPALEELGGRRRVGDGLGEHGQLARVVGAEQRGGAVAAVALV